MIKRIFNVLSGFSISTLIIGSLGTVFIVLMAYFIVFGSGLTDGGHAATTSKQSHDELVAAQNNVRDYLARSGLASHGLKVIAVSPAGDGMTAVILGGSVPPTVALVPPDDRGIILGNMFEGDVNVTDEIKQNYLKRQMALQVVPGANGQQIVPAIADNPDEVAVGHFIANSDLRGVQQGSGPIQLIVFFDPDCIFCHEFWTRLQMVHGWRSAFTVSWVPVGFLKPESAAKGAAILLGGSEMLDQNEQDFNIQSETGAAPVSTSQQALDVVENNTVAWEDGVRQLGRNAATPTIVVMGKLMQVGDLPLDYLQNIANLAVKN